MINNFYNPDELKELAFKKIGKDVLISRKASFYNTKNIEIGSNVRIDDFCILSSKIKIGNYVHIGCLTSITGSEEFIMDDFCGISQGCRILTASEDFLEWGFGNPTVPEEYRNVKKAPIKMDKFAIIGANSIICPGVTIGEGVSVAASSVVTWSLAPWGIYAGNRKISERNREGVLKTYEKFLQRNK